MAKKLLTAILEIIIFLIIFSIKATITALLPRLPVIVITNFRV